MVCAMTDERIAHWFDEEPDRHGIMKGEEGRLEPKPRPCPPLPDFLRKTRDWQPPNSKVLREYNKAEYTGQNGAPSAYGNHPKS